MKTYTIGTSWKRLLAVSAVLSAVMTGSPGVSLACSGTKTSHCSSLQVSNCGIYYEDNSNGKKTCMGYGGLNWPACSPGAGC